MSDPDEPGKPPPEVGPSAEGEAPSRALATVDEPRLRIDESTSASAPPTRVAVDGKAPAARPTSARPPAERQPSFVEKLRAAPITFALVAINAAVFLWAETHGGTTDYATLLRFGAMEPILFWAGEYWRVVTYMFMHQGWMHILMNMYVLIGWGAPLERALGKKRYLLLYALTGLGAGCASVIGGILFGLHPSVGASGALFGIIGAVLALRRRQLPSFAAFFADKAIRSTLLQIGLWTVIGGYALKLDNAAHFGGFAVGFVVCWLYTARSPRYLWLAFGAAFAALFVIAARPTWTPRGEDANDLRSLARAYLTGHNGPKPWPKNVARGERLLEKGCKSGVASACLDLAKHIETVDPGAASRAAEIRRRGCDLDPGVCDQLD